jgi:hypothetical protein
MLTLVEAAGLVGADDMFEACVFNGILECGFDLLAAFRKTAWPGRGLIAFVGANEDVMLKFRQWPVPFSSPHYTSECAAPAAF